MAIGKPFATLPTVAVDKAAVEPMLGVYKFAAAQRTLSLADGKLSVQRAGRPPSEIFAAGDNRFHYSPDELSWFELRKDAAGKPVMAFHPNGEDEVDLGTWSGPVPVVTEIALPREALAAFAGIYSTPMGKATIAFGEGDSLTIQLAGQPALPMLATSATEFLVEKAGTKVSFIASGAKVSDLEIEQNGQKLPGKRD